MNTRTVAMIVLLLITIATGIGVVYARQMHREAFIALSQLERERDELNIEFGRLQLEQATWAETHRIEQVARVKLGMKFPEGAEIVVVTP